MVSIRGVTRSVGDDGAASRGATVDVFRDEWCVYCTVLLKLIEIIIITHRTAIHARIVRDETLDSDSASDDRRLSSLTTRPFVLDRGRARCQRSPPRASSSCR